MQTQIDMHFFRPFIEGTIHTLKVQIETVAEFGKPFLKNKDEQQLKIDIAGIISVFSTHFNGTICICFPEKTFLNFMEKMLGEKYEKITDDISDGAGELTNIIYGYAKRVLNDKGFDLEKALPSVVAAEGLKLHLSDEHPVIILPFSTPLGNFQMQISFIIHSQKK